MNLLHVENINSLLGKKMNVNVLIKGANAIPAKFCSDVFA